MAPHRSNYVTFTRGTLTITVANGETTLAEGYGGILVDILNQKSEPEPFLLKNVWYVPQLDWQPAVNHSCSVKELQQSLWSRVAPCLKSVTPSHRSILLSASSGYARPPNHPSRIKSP